MTRDLGRLKIGRQMMRTAKRFVVRTALFTACLALAGCEMPGWGSSEPVVNSTAAAPAAPVAAPVPAAAPADVAPVVEPQTETADAPASLVAEPSNRARWGALFVAGDHSITAFDNATRRFYSLIERKPLTKLRRLTSDTSIAPSPEEIASLGTIDAAMGFTTGTQTENCLVFLTSHGSENGFFLSQHDGVGGLLPPRTLDWLLDKHCGQRPTVAIVSACYSGIFLEEGMEQPNRIIITAARRDRPSFGCSADQVYTYFDKCLLDSWTWSYTWSELYDRTRNCVAEREVEMGARPSEPQAFFGAAVADLAMP